MKKQNGAFDAEELNLIKLAQEYSDPDRARELLESLLWPNGPICPHCKFDEAYKITAKPGSKSPVRAGLYKCAACRKEFTVTVGTIFEDSHLPISKWLMAFFILCSSKKAISAHQLHRMLGITYKTAWFMAHRIRHSMAPKMPLGKLLTGTVEVDETFVGGKGDIITRDRQILQGASRRKSQRERIRPENAGRRDRARQHLRKLFLTVKAWRVWFVASCQSRTPAKIRERICLPLESPQGNRRRADGCRTQGN